MDTNVQLYYPLETGSTKPYSNPCHARMADTTRRWCAASTLSKDCSSGITTVFSTVCTVGTRRWSTTGKVHHSVDELELGHLHIFVRHGKLELVADPTATPAPAPLKKKFCPSPTTALKCSGNDGGYSQLHRTQAPPQTDVIIDLASSLCTGWSPRGRGSLSQGRRHSTDTSSGQQLPKECRPSSDPARCPCRLLAGS